MRCISRVPLEARAADRVWAFRKVLASRFTQRREEGGVQGRLQGEKKFRFHCSPSLYSEQGQKPGKAEQTMELCINVLICIKSLGLSGTGPPMFVYPKKLFLVSGPRRSSLAQYCPCLAVAYPGSRDLRCFSIVEAQIRQQSQAVAGSGVSPRSCLC